MIERAHRSPVPSALIRAHSSFSLRFMMEATPIHKQGDEEFAAGKEKRAAAKVERAAKLKAKRAAEPKTQRKAPILFKKKVEYDRQKIGMSPDEMKELAKKDTELAKAQEQIKQLGRTPNQPGGDAGADDDPAQNREPKTKSWGLAAQNRKNRAAFNAEHGGWRAPNASPSK